MIENRREPPLQLPRGEEERPVDERHEIGERHILERATPDERGHRQRRGCPVDPQPVPQRRARRAAAARSFAGRVPLAQLLLQRSRFAWTNAGCSVSLSSFDTTSTTRDASSTWTVALLYSGAIFTAVCWRLVVAPPMSSGRLSCRRSISLATNTISSSDGVMSPLRPTMSASIVDGGLQDAVGRAPSRPDRPPRSCCTRARRPRCSCRCRGHRP